MLAADFMSLICPFCDVERRDVEIVDEECIRIFQRVFLVTTEACALRSCCRGRAGCVGTEAGLWSVARTDVAVGVVDPVRFEMLYTVPAEWLLRRVPSVDYGK